MHALNNSPISDFALHWLEDEIFFSICSRQHLYLGNINQTSTLAWLFGSHKASTTHDFPFNLDSLNECARNAWGDTTSIIFQHTILPLFFPFQSPQNIEQTLDTLKSSTLGSLKYRLGLLTGRFGAEHPLKACNECIISDRAASGVAYWHLMHQYPGVIVCPEHHLLLRECSRNRQWSGRFQWCLPDDLILLPEQHDECPADELRRLEALSLAIKQLAELGSGTNFHPDIVNKTYRTALAELNVGRASGQSAADSLARYVAPLRRYTSLSSLPATADGTAGLLGQLTRRPRRHCHPLKHLIFIQWLFGSLDDFVEAYDRTSVSEMSFKDIQGNSDIDPQTYPSNTPPSGNCKAAIRRPKTLKEPLRSEILSKLAIGEDKETVCELFKITISTVNKLLRSEPYIRNQWVVHRKLQSTTFYRQAWLLAMKSHPDFGVKHLRSCCLNIYGWLYRNDKPWLKSQIEKLPSGRRGNYSKIDWLERDAKLVESILDFIKSKSNEGSVIDRVTLYFRFPQLAKCLARDKHYPQTKKLVRRLVGRPRADQT
ncbi:TnsD family Tn7-like transposition protein [Pseudomonas mosselii]|uniref:TnsD family Tn7-like transposition protein n=1 Tax=Pseudomonas mosselii TaxID=78327 RepID=UPI000C12B93F|nr:TnsD family Tn7-like transposition protein [Pseudomonas mosselii]